MSCKMHAPLFSVLVNRNFFLMYIIFPYKKNVLSFSIHILLTYNVNDPSNCPKHQSKRLNDKPLKSTIVTANKENQSQESLSKYTQETCLSHCRAKVFRV